MTRSHHLRSGRTPVRKQSRGHRVLWLLAALAATLVIQCVFAYGTYPPGLRVIPDPGNNKVDFLLGAKPRHHEPGPDQNPDIPDPTSDGEVTVSLKKSECWDYKEPPEFRGTGWNTIDHYSATLCYDSDNPVCAYEGHWGGPLKNTCNGGGGGGPGTPPEFTLDIDGTGPEDLHIQKPNSPDEQGPFILCVGCDLTVESAIFTENATSAVPCDWTVNGISALPNSDTFDIPGDFPASLLDSSGIQDPGSYSLEAEYQCPENTGTLTAAASHTAVKVESLTGGDETCTDANAASPPTIYVGLDEEVTFTATPDPSNPFPLGEPDWELAGPTASPATITAGGDGNAQTTVKFTAPTADIDNPETVKVRCGPDDVWKSIEVLVVQVFLGPKPGRFPRCIGTPVVDSDFQVIVSPTALTSLVTLHHNSLPPPSSSADFHDMTCLATINVDP